MIASKIEQLLKEEESPSGLVDMTEAYNKVTDLIEQAAEKGSVVGEGEIDDDQYDEIFDTLDERFQDELGSQVTLSRDEMYEVDAVLEFARAPLKGYTTLVKEASDGDWVLRLFNARAAGVIRGWAGGHPDHYKL